MAAPSRPRNGDNPRGMPNKMRTPPGGWQGFFSAWNVKRGPNGEVCPTCVQFGECKEHPAPCLCGEIRDDDCGHPDCWIAHPPEESSETPRGASVGNAERSSNPTIPPSSLPEEGTT